MSGNKERIRKKRNPNLCYAPNFGHGCEDDVPFNQKPRVTFDIDLVGCRQCICDARKYEFITPEQSDEILDELDAMLCEGEYDE